MYDVEEVYKKYAKQIYNYMLYMSHNIDLAEELTQETFYRAIRNINKFREECEIDIWLCRIAKNLYYENLTKNKKIIDINDLEEKESILKIERI